MIIRLLAVGQKMPQWVTTGFNEYARRFPSECKLELHEIATGKRGKNADIERLKTKEANAMEMLLSSADHIVALEVEGKSWSTHQLAGQLEHWQQMGKNVALLVGGPEGLSKRLSSRADQKWSLSALTLPHPLVRIVVAEALYRAWSQTVNHPYHRQ